MYKVTAIIGCMFAGKSTKLIELIQTAKKQNKNFLVVKPDLDNRYATDYIVTHDNLQYHAYNVSRGILGDLDLSQLEVLFIDEVQFFDYSVVDVIRNLARLGKEIIFSGLNYDYRKERFKNVEHLLPYCREIIHLYAACDCGADAIYTKRIIESDDLILVGGEESYKAVCPKCY
jgi:thymidine kinase